MPRQPAKRSAYHHGHLRAALIDAATALVATHGTEGFSLREAAARIGVSASASYRHFADRGDLLAAVAQEGFAALAVAMEQAAGNARRGRRRAPISVAALEGQALAYVRFAVDHPTRFQVMFGPYGAGSSRAGRGVGASGMTPYQLLQASLDALVADGVLSVRARRDAELPVWCAMHGLAAILVNRALVNPDSTPLERTARHVLRTALAGLSRRGERTLQPYS